MNYLFIVGVGRSGTTLLQSMFAAHSQIAMLPETSFIRRYIAINKMKKTYQKSGIDHLRHTIEQDGHLNRLDPAIVNKAFGVIDKDGGPMDFSFYKSLLDRHAFRKGAAMAADKDPRSIEYLPLIKHYFPDAHVVHIIRDPRDVLSSKKKAQWSMNRHPGIHIFANQVQLRIGRKLGRKLFAERYHEIHFESLLMQPAETLQGLSKEIGIVYESAMVHEYRQSAGELVHDSEMSWKKETLGPIITTNINKWKRHLKNWEVALTEWVCSEAFRLGTYEKSNALRLLKPLKAILIILISIGMKMVGPVYEGYRRWKLSRSIP